MTIAVGWHVVDKVDNAVLESASIEAVHDVGNKRARISQWHYLTPSSCVVAANAGSCLEKTL